MKEFIYRINQLNKIYFVNSDWIQFGNDNGLQKPIAAVMDTLLWGHIFDWTTRQLYLDLAGMVRKTNRSVRVPFRCDGPAVRRFMELDMSSLPEAHIEFKGRLLREEPRKPMDILDSTLPRIPELLQMCVWCKKVKASEWMEIENAVTEMRLFDRAALPFISHVTCPNCLHRNSEMLIELSSEFETDKK
jgi:hypothetical protein